MGFSIPTQNFCRTKDGKVDLKETAKACTRPGMSSSKIMEQLRKELPSSEVANRPILETKAYSGTTSFDGFKQGRKQNESLLDGVPVSASKIAGENGFGLISYTV